MSELINHPLRRDMLRHLLTTVSALTLCVVAAAPALAEDASRPALWVELGGQLERVSGESAVFAPFFLAAHAGEPAFAHGTPIDAQALPRYAKGLEGKIAFTPEGSDWTFSAGLLYGRSNGDKRVQYQTPGKPLPGGFFAGNPNYDPAKNVAFTDTRGKDREGHLILDFKAGKDVGLGAANLSLGIRFAQFTSEKSAHMRVRPDVQFTQVIGLYLPYMSTFTANAESKRSFTGIGPSISLDGSTKLAGDSRKSFTFDWGASGAVLFGRQKAGVTHETSKIIWDGGNFLYHTNYVYDHPYAPPARNHSRVVPDLGGFAGFSVRYSNAKISLGYRADFFFGAMDTGIELRKTANVGFHGPFATVSVGLGG